MLSRRLQAVKGLLYPFGWGWQAGASAVEGMLWLVVGIIAVGLAAAVLSNGRRAKPPSEGTDELLDGEFLSAVAGEAQQNPDGTWRQEIIRRCSVGDSVKLVPEPDNPYDANAVKVVHRLGLVGYIPREKARRFAREIGRGCIVTSSIYEITGRDKATLGVVLRVRVDDHKRRGRP